MSDTPFLFHPHPGPGTPRVMRSPYPRSPSPNDQLHMTRFHWLYAAAQLPGGVASRRFPYF